MKTTLWTLSALGMFICGAIYWCVQANGQVPAARSGSKPVPAQALTPPHPDGMSPRHENASFGNENAPSRYGYPPNGPQAGMGMSFFPPQGMPGMSSPAFQAYPATPIRNAGPDGRVETPIEVREALHKLRTPDLSESEKADAKETIKEFLTEAFEKDLKARRSHVSRLEEQLDRLKKQLEKRQEAQSKIIELRMQLLENEADGLAFPDSWVELQTIRPSDIHGSANVPGRPMVSLPMTNSTPAYSIPGSDWPSTSSAPTPSTVPGPSATLPGVPVPGIPGTSPVSSPRSSRP